MSSLNLPELRRCATGLVGRTDRCRGISIGYAKVGASSGDEFPLGLAQQSGQVR